MKLGFVGRRGCGKTTAIKLFSEYINNPKISFNEYTIEDPSKLKNIECDIAVLVLTPQYRNNSFEKQIIKHFRTINKPIIGLVTKNDTLKSDPARYPKHLFIPCAYVSYDGSNFDSLKEIIKLRENNSK